MDEDTLIQQARLLVQRLERLSADSLWAHRASGYRASLLKALDQVDQAELSADERRAALDHLDFLIGRSFVLLEKAARELIKGRLARLH